MFTHAELLNETTSLRKFAMKLTRNCDDADDLLQSTLVTALDKQDRFEQGTNLFSWTSRILFNNFVSAYRRRSRFETQYDPQIYIDQETVEAPQEHEAELNLVMEAMLSLSEDHREILRMICIDGMKYGEVAETLNIPVGTVRSRLSRAREGLQEWLNVSRNDRKQTVLTNIQRSPLIRREAEMVAKAELANLVAANEAYDCRLNHQDTWHA